MKNTDKYIKYALLSTSLFLILPNKIKEVPFAILGLISLIIYFKEKRFMKEHLFFLSFFLINFLSLAYTENVKEGFSKIEGLLPFFYLSIAYLVITKKYNISPAFTKKWVLIFNLSNTLFLFLFFIYCLFYLDEFSYNNLRTALDTLPLINIHPIYISIIGVLGLFMFLKFKSSNRKLDFLFGLIHLSFILLSGVRATLLCIPLLVIVYLYLLNRSFIFKLKLLIVCLLSLTLLLFLNKDLVKRLSEINNSTSYTNLSLDNSTSIRFAIWDCALMQIKSSNVLIGEGIGDVRMLLMNCYQSKYPDINKYYNTHNQYFFIYLTVGSLGLLSFFVYVFYLYKTANIDDKKYLILSLLFYLYMFNFENILERKYGILIYCFFTYFVFNIFLQRSNKDLQTLS